MPPAKTTTKTSHDDPKTDSAHTKDKNGLPAGSSSKMRRVASATGPQPRENVPGGQSKGAGVNTTKPANPKEDVPQPGIDWNSFDREILHAYRREHRLSTSTCYSSSYRQMILSQPGSIGLYSPSMMRKSVDRRQSKEQLALSVRKHFNSVGVQENDVIVDFIHKVRSHSIAKADRVRRPHLPLDLER